MNNKHRLLLAAFLLFLAGNAFPHRPPEKPVQVIILHTNDMHAKIDNLGKLAYLSDSLKKIFPYVYLVSAGDNFTGNPVVDMVDDRGYPMIDLMNACGFDASAIGNHEFDMGQEFLAKRIKQAAFPFICANIRTSGSTMEQPPAYWVLKAGKNASIPMLGLIQLGDNGLPDSHPSRFEGLQFTEGIMTFKNYAWLKEKYGNLVGLTHLGVETDMELAKSVPQFDLIIGGHSHTLLDTALFENGVMIVQAGWGLKYVGKTTLIIQKGHITGRKDEVIILDSIRKSDPEVQAMIDKYNANPELYKVVGVAETNISGFDELGSLITDAQRTQMKTDFAFMNRRGIRMPSIRQGNITIKDIYQVDPFQNEVVIFGITAAEIESLIRYGYENLQNKIDLAVSGMTYTISADSLGKYLSAEMKESNGNPLNPQKEYTVAMNSYIATSYKFEHKDPGKSSGMTSEEILINYLREVQKINYSGAKRTFLEQRKDNGVH
jgi:5'-nucleotidase / UDP-sugar diphosphatase